MVDIVAMNMDMEEADMEADMERNVMGVNVCVRHSLLSHAYCFL